MMHVLGEINFPVMDKRSTSYVEMFVAVVACCNASPSVVAAIPAFKNGKDELEAIVTEIQGLMQQQLQITSGIATSKSAQKVAMCTLGADVASGVYAWTAVNDDLVNMAKVDLSFSDLMDYREGEAPLVCLNIHELASDNLAALADYGVTARMVDELKRLADAYKEAEPEPRLAKADKKAVRENLARLIGEGRLVLTKRMDKTARLLARTSADFVKQYKVSRKLVRLPTVHTQMKGKVTNAATGAAIENAEVVIEELGLVLHSDVNGEFESGMIPNGVYRVRVSATGFARVVVGNVRVKKGKIAHLNCQLAGDN